ncbi:MAG: L-seryl-tRNA(Sec) selenium transferase [Acidobacteria bacterium]|nr:MAG: L-seryl-tRNA(Sec) selenium transferase [Acidobacteriota bacterium]
MEALRAEAEAVRREPAIAAAEPDGASITGARPEGGATDNGAEATRAAIANRIASGAERRIKEQAASSLVPVINATGVIVHTNLGRAPLCPAALGHVTEISRGYSTLEYDVARGHRGSRDFHVSSLIRRVTGCEAAVVVNNNAAATLLILTALASDREVVISRGELVEIGGGFRVPDVMAQSGAILREVGTTNKTRLSDYASAIGERTALILRVHRSNFRIEGFTEQPALAELAALGHERGIPVVEDLGSGWLLAATTTLPGGAPLPAHLAAVVRHEPSVPASLAAGMDLVCFSGDKLLGGPQAGIIAGRADLVEAVRRHPLMRALRVDKMVYAALEATLAEYVRGNVLTEVPVLKMLAATPEQIGARASAIVEALAGTGLHAQVIDGTSAIGGGSAPGLPVPTRLIALSSERATAAELEERLRSSNPPVIARVENDAVLLDLRTVTLEQADLLLAAIRRL